jgi:hypothetical protein
MKDTNLENKIKKNRPIEFKIAFTIKYPAARSSTSMANGATATVLRSLSSLLVCKCMCMKIYFYFGICNDNGSSAT